MTRVKVDGVSLTSDGLVPKIQKSMLSNDVDAMQPHVRAPVERAVVFTNCPDCESTTLSNLVAGRSTLTAEHRAADVGA